MRLEDRAWVERTLEAHPELGEVVVGLVRQAIVSRIYLPRRQRRFGTNGRGWTFPKTRTSDE
jgi:hypothetical protein